MHISSPSTIGSQNRILLLARILFGLVPRLLVTRCTATRLAGYGIALRQSGYRQLGDWCLSSAIERSASDERSWNRLMDLCIAGLPESAMSVMDSLYERGGLFPSSVVRSIGGFVLGHRYEAALTLFDRLSRTFGERLLDLAPSPGLDLIPSLAHVRECLTLALESHDDAGAIAETERAAALREIDLQWARLCFAFGAFDTSTRLFERAGTPDPRDDVARAYGKTRWNASSCASAGVAGASSNLADPGWLTLRATTRFFLGASQDAAADVEVALRHRYLDHPDLQQIVDDCRAMIDVLGRCHPTMSFVDTADERQQGSSSRGATPKLFICGHGWSGSGAVYDALLEFDLFSPPLSGLPDRHLNEDTEVEHTFVQGPAGLGIIWRHARRTNEVARADLWDLLRCHIIGAGAIGYAEYKSARMAAALVNRFGAAYTAILRRLFDELAPLETGPRPLSALRRLLCDTAEALCSLLAAGSPDRIVLLNNAVFAPNLDMLAIFENFKAIVITRNPLDQYADRKLHDLKHWMSAERFAAFYCESLTATRLQLKALGKQAARCIRLVEFESFVRDHEYRDGVLRWALDGWRASRVRKCFDPNQSAVNIGIHRTVLSDSERETIARALRARGYSAAIRATRT